MTRIIDERAVTPSFFNEVEIGNFFFNPIDNDLLVKISNESGISLYDKKIEYFGKDYEVQEVDVDIYIRRTIDASK